PYPLLGVHGIDRLARARQLPPPSVVEGAARLQLAPRHRKASKHARVDRNAAEQHRCTAPVVKKQRSNENMRGERSVYCIPSAAPLRRLAGLFSAFFAVNNGLLTRFRL